MWGGTCRGDRCAPVHAPVQWGETASIELRGSQLASCSGAGSGPCSKLCLHCLLGERGGGQAGSRGAWAGYFPGVSGEGVGGGRGTGRQAGGREQVTFPGWMVKGEGGGGGQAGRGAGQATFLGWVVKG